MEQSLISITEWFKEKFIINWDLFAIFFFLCLYTDNSSLTNIFFRLIVKKLQ